MNYTDTHCHIYTEQFDEDRNEVINSSIGLGIRRFLLPAIDSTYSERLINLASNYPDQIFPMFGLHPCSVKENWKEELRLVEHDLFNNSSKLSPIAVGEIGLDLYWERSFLEQQVEALEIQINWAKKLGLPIVIHVRAAFDEIFEVIDSLNDDSLTGVFHCFTGNLSQANHILDYGGFKLGLGGVLTFKNSGLDKTIEQIDLKHLILETDSPYLAPHPHRGKRNEPAYLMLVAKKLAEVKGVLLEEVSRVTEINTNEIFFPKQLED